MRTARDGSDIVTHGRYATNCDQQRTVSEWAADCRRPAVAAMTNTQLTTKQQSVSGTISATLSFSFSHSHVGDATASYEGELQFRIPSNVTLPVRIRNTIVSHQCVNDIAVTISVEHQDNDLHAQLLQVSADTPSLSSLSRGSQTQSDLFLLACNAAAQAHFQCARLTPTMSEASRQQYFETDAHHPPPPPYHQVHSSPSLDAAVHQPSPPSYSHSSPSPLSSLLDYLPSLSPPSSPHAAPSADSLLPLVHLSLGLLSGYSWGYTARHLTRPLLASLAMSVTLLSLAQQQGWVDVRWARVEGDVRQWVERYAARGDALYRSVQRRIQHHSEHDADAVGEYGAAVEDDGSAAAADGWEDQLVRAVEALAVRLLTTASGVGFTLGLVYALVRKR